MSTVTDFESQDRRRLEDCQQRLGYQFNNLELLHSALTHSSGASHKLGSNERLEFLGDAILGAVVCDQLYHQFPRLLEGDLTKIKSEIVSRRSCARFTRVLGIEQFLIVGKGMGDPSRAPVSLLADVFESVVAAIFLDGGLSAAGEFVQRCIRPLVERAAEEGSPDNYKSMLQQKTQRELSTTPTYELVDQRGPDHNKCFKIAAVIGKRNYAPCVGAQQERSSATGGQQRAGGT